MLVSLWAACRCVTAARERHMHCLECISLPCMHVCYKYIFAALQYWWTALINRHGLLLGRLTRIGQACDRRAGAHKRSGRHIAAPERKVQRPRSHPDAVRRVQRGRQPAPGLALSSAFVLIPFRHPHCPTCATKDGHGARWSICHAPPLQSFFN